MGEAVPGVCVCVCVCVCEREGERERERESESVCVCREGMGNVYFLLSLAGHLKLL
jgi:hypothetical protein